MKILALFCLLAVATAIPLTAQTYPLAQQSPSSWPNVTFASIRGYRFQCNASNVTVTQLGCYYPDSSSQSKTLQLFNFNTQQMLAQVTTTPGSGWRWATLSTPVALTNGTQYVVTGYSTTGHYYNNSVPASWMPTGTIQYMDMRYLNSPTSPNQFPSGGTLATSHHGVVDIGYTTGPTVGTSTGTLNLGTAFANSPGTAQNYTVQGSQTTNPTTITAPANVEIKLSTSSNWDSTVNIPNTGTWGPFTIDARIASTSSPTTITGNITHVSTGANGSNVAVSGDVVPPPSLTVTPASLDLGTTPQGTAGSVENFTITGTATTSSTVITAPTGVEVSATQATWSNSYTINSTGNWSTTTIYVRISASASAGAISGDVTCVTTGDTQNVAVTGTVVPPPTLQANPTSLNLGTTSVGTPGTEFSYTLDGSNLVADTVITAPAGVEISETSGSNYASDITLTTTPSYSVTIFVRLTGASVGTVNGDITNVSSTAGENVAITGDVTANDNLSVTRNGPGATTFVDNDEQGPNGDGFVILDFTVTAGTNPWTLTDITFNQSGSADGQADISFLALYEDDGNGTWDGPATDTLATAAAGTGFNGPNGDYTAALSNSNVPATTGRRFFLVAKLAGSAVAGETIHAEITGATANSTAGSVVGLPTAGTNPALEINPAELTVTFNGPVAFNTVNNDSQGPNGDGHVICDITVEARNDAWTISELTFSASGSADEQADISFLALYEDDGNGTWDGPATDTLATAAAGTSFDAPDGNYTATLTAAGTIAMNGSARYFLVARLAGSATSGQDFRAALTAITENSASGGSVNGVPTAASSALVIDVPTLTVNAGPNSPGNTSIEAGPAFEHVLAQFRLTASNEDFTVSGITLTLGGNGDWVNNIAAVGVYLDDGNGVYDAADSQLFSGAASGGSLTCGFATNLTVTDGTSADLWIVLEVAATAGGSPSETFSAGIAAPADVAAVTTGGQVLFGSNPPQSGELRVITWSFGSFTPLSASTAGGAPITITGTGFDLPVQVTIGGVPCGGTPVVNAAGTQITGLTVPAGSGNNLPIVMTTNNLAPKTLPATFTYLLSSTSGGGGGGGGGGCTTGTGGTALLAILSLLATATLTRRRAHKRLTRSE